MTTIADIRIKDRLVHKFLSRHTHTHLTDWSTWTTEMIGKQSELAKRFPV